jgi:hypothetical protein
MLDSPRNRGFFHGVTPSATFHGRLASPLL